MAYGEDDGKDNGKGQRYVCSTGKEVSGEHRDRDRDTTPYEYFE